MSPLLFEVSLFTVFLALHFKRAGLYRALHACLCVNVSVCVHAYVCVASAAANHAPAAARIQLKPTISAYYLGYLERYLLAFGING